MVRITDNLGSYQSIVVKNAGFGISYLCLHASAPLTDAVLLGDLVNFFVPRFP